jgi:hypothetical protein
MIIIEIVNQQKYFNEMITLSFFALFICEKIIHFSRFNMKKSKTTNYLLYFNHYFNLKRKNKIIQYNIIYYTINSKIHNKLIYIGSI